MYLNTVCSVDDNTHLLTLTMCLKSIRHKFEDITSRISHSTFRCV